MTKFHNFQNIPTEILKCYDLDACVGNMDALLNNMDHPPHAVIEQQRMARELQYTRALMWP